MSAVHSREVEVDGPGKADVAELHRRAQQYDVAAEHLDEPFAAHATGIASGLRHVADEIELIDQHAIRQRAARFKGVSKPITDDPACMWRLGHADGLQLAARALADDSEGHHGGICPECEWPGEFQRATGADPPVERYDCPGDGCLVRHYSYDPRVALRGVWT